MGQALKIGDKVRFIGVTPSTMPPGYNSKAHGSVFVTNGTLGFVDTALNVITTDGVFKVGTYVHGVVFEGHPRRLYVPPEWLEKIDPDRDSCNLNLEQLLDSIRREVISDPKIEIERDEPA